jgi:hypothetical protein
VAWFGQQKVDYSSMNPTREPTPEEQLLTGGVSPREEQSNSCRFKFSNPCYPESELLAPKPSDIRGNADVLGLITEFTKIKISDNTLGGSKAPSLAMFGKRSQPHPMSPDTLQPHPMSPDTLQPHPMSPDTLQPHPMSPDTLQPHPMSPISSPFHRNQNPGDPQTFREAQNFTEAQNFRKTQNLCEAQNIGQAQNHNQYTPAPQRQPTHYNDFYYWKVTFQLKIYRITMQITTISII